MFPLRACALISCASLAVSALAVEARGQTPTPLDPIVITASRFAEPADRVGSAVTIIGRDQIEAARAENVLEVLETVPGVIVNQSGGIGGTAAVSIRGAADDQTLVLLDGVRVNDPASTGSEFDFSVFSLANVERIEVLRGAQSGLYGSDAIGGVINIITRKGGPDPQAKAEIEGGSYSTFAQRGFVSGSESGVSVAAAASNFRTSGFSRSSRGTEDDATEKTSANVRLDIEPAETFGVTVALGHYHVDAELDASTSDTDDDVERTLRTAAVTARLDLLDGRFTNKLTGFATSSERVFFDDNGDAGPPRAAQDSVFDGTSEGFEYQGDVTVREVDRLSFGAKIDAQSGRSFVDGETSGRRESFAGDEVWRSAFALYSFNPTDALTITAAGRIDEFGPVEPEETYRLTAAYRFPDFGTKLRGSYGTGAKAPTLQQRGGLAGLAIGNPDLAVETSEGFDAGIDQSLLDGRVTLSATYFHNEVKDLIEFVDQNDPRFPPGLAGCDPADFCGTFVNRDETRLEGVEIGATVIAAHWLTLAGSYTYLDARDAGTDERLQRRPEHTAHARAVLKPLPALELIASAHYVGERFSRSGERDLLDDYLRIDLSGRYDLNDNAEFFFRAENLTDEDYEEVLNFGTAGRSGYAGLRISF